MLVWTEGKHPLYATRVKIQIRGWMGGGEYAPIFLVPTLIAVSNHSYEPTTNWEECVSLMPMHNSNFLKTQKITGNIKAYVDVEYSNFLKTQKITF